MSYVLLIGGIAALLFGADAMVRGAIGLARSLGISPLFVGLTVVAFGTSAPELVVNVVGALRGETGIAFGNVIGSNLANLGLVLGVTALVAPVAVQGKIVRREIPLLVVASTLLLILAADSELLGEVSMIDLSDGLALLLVLGIFLYVTVGDVVRNRDSEPVLALVGEAERFRTVAPLYANLLWLAGGLVLLYVGGEFTIDGALAIAVIWRIPENVVGIAVLAIGTSLPELMTSVVAAYRRQPDLAVGNLVGSNIFNILFVLPVSALIIDIDIPVLGEFDLMFSLLLTALLIPIAILGQGAIGRIWGGVLVAVYLAYLVLRVFFV